MYEGTLRLFYPQIPLQQKQFRFHSFHESFVVDNKIECAKNTRTCFCEWERKNYFYSYYICTIAYTYRAQKKYFLLFWNHTRATILK
jgi:hypothetical protein